MYYQSIGKRFVKFAVIFRWLKRYHNTTVSAFVLVLSVCRVSTYSWQGKKEQLPIVHILGAWDIRPRIARFAGHPSLPCSKFVLSKRCLIPIIRRWQVLNKYHKRVFHLATIVFHWWRLWMDHIISGKAEAFFLSRWLLTGMNLQWTTSSSSSRGH